MAAVILASSRSDGHTRALAEWAFPPADVVYEDLSALRVGCFSYDRANEADDFLPLIRRLHAHDLWVLATPLYWYTMSAQAKTFFDRLSDLLKWHKDDGRRLRGKALAVVCAGADPQDHIDLHECLGGLRSGVIARASERPGSSRRGGAAQGNSCRAAWFQADLARRRRRGRCAR